jgi:adenosine deaminase
MLSDELAQDVLNTPDLAGIDLHGDERVDISLEHYAEIYDEARRLGLRTKAHAGELRDSSSVVEILEKLRPQRIQHGVTAAKDAAVLALLAEQQIILDMCPTSNVRLRVVPNIRSYPIRTFLEHDIEVTINTDDPSIFGCTLSGELSAMIEHKLLSLSEIVSLQSQAFARADIDETVRSAVEAELEVCLAKLEI